MGMYASMPCYLEAGRQALRKCWLIVPYNCLEFIACSMNIHQILDYVDEQDLDYLLSDEFPHRN